MPNIGLLLEFVGRLDPLISKINERLEGKDRRSGGYFCAFDAGQRPEEPPIILAKIGDPNPEKLAKYTFLCQEKARRLLRNPGHISSWESRDLERELYGGAIRTPDSVYGFSGLIEHADEAMLAVPAFELGILSGTHSKRIASISNNPLIFPLISA